MKIFTMVKGEVDIVEDWVLYHGHLFGFRNLYVIDNMSLDGTYESLLMLKNKYGINVTRLPDYTKKGEYMTMLLRSFGNNEIVFPIDIDEFIVYYDKKSNRIMCNNEILNYIRSLPKLPIYKMNYIQSKNYSTTGEDNVIHISDLAGFYNFIAEITLQKVSCIIQENYHNRLKAQNVAKWITTNLVSI